MKLQNPGKVFVPAPPFLPTPVTETLHVVNERMLKSVRLHADVLQTHASRGRSRKATVVYFFHKQQCNDDNNNRSSLGGAAKDAE